MSITADDEPKHEIIIVKRGHGDHEEGHHGGVWKIAFADFMTAMMCFFLVMWLINASNEQTQAAVASYFNPVKLIDRNSSKKGLEDVGDGPHSAGASSDTSASEQVKPTEGVLTANPSTQKEDDASKSENHSDKYLFANPYAVLSEIAEETGVLQNISEKGDGGAQLSGPSSGASGGEAYRDPFAPDFWTQQVASAPETAQGAVRKPKMDGDNRTETPEDVMMEAVPSDTAPLQELAGKKPKAVAAEDHADPAKTDEHAEPVDKEEKAPSAETVKAADAIREELAQSLAADPKIAEGLSVVAGEKGVVISVTDQFDFGMFEIGSALPRRELVLAMEKIGKTLAEQKGTLTINGHTDARPFRSADYDNWRLSSARAHSAYYMLVRGGLDEARITEVSGHADRELKDTNDPFGASNRRIEILLDVDG
ncbi:MAG: MotB family protein [Alphaproteobacteria bacterium]|nr:MotB family protein [Alphaproteobacteria bacterium]MBU0801870.1 MotB family protein [Alphaproteobacteria bacterium]MBU0873765.1 MotB family protein [Alphaproteobacteria bacterium]MBU1403151.1 MotB family protein [Alphaproteobacteria bacterium]MBU1593892.1 MotB family protein [Alphaproteobacteria bacterium]